LPPPSDDAPLLLVIAGPNGSGKSTAYRDTDFEREGRSFWVVNPDLLAARIHQAEGMTYQDANLQAVTRIESWLRSCIDVHKSIGVETVLSTDKYRSAFRRRRPRVLTSGFCMFCSIAQSET
jgi:predicted ABC-type ATPase